MNSNDSKTIDESKEIKQEIIQLFPAMSDGLDTLSELFNGLNEDTYNTTYNSLSDEQKEIIDRPMLFFARKILRDFEEWGIDLIKYLAVLYGLDINRKDEHWIINIRGIRDER